MYLEHERYYGLSMDALVIEGASNTNAIAMGVRFASRWLLLCDSH